MQSNRARTVRVGLEHVRRVAHEQIVTLVGVGLVQARHIALRDVLVQVRTCAQYVVSPQAARGLGLALTELELAPSDVAAECKAGKEAAGAGE